MMILLLDIRDNSPPPPQQHHRPRYALTHLTINMLLLKYFTDKSFILPRMFIYLDMSIDLYILHVHSPFPSLDVNSFHLRTK